MTKVSIILPVFKVEKYIDRCVNVIIEQTFTDFEAIFVIDGSPDNCESILKRYSDKDERIRVYSKPNTGSGYTRNYGLDKSNGEYIYFMDPDDWIENNLLENVVGYADKYQAEVTMFGYWSENEQNQKSKEFHNSELKFYENNFDISKDFTKIFSENVVYAPWNKLYKKQFLVENNLYFSNQKTGQDALFNIEVFRKISKLLLIPDCYYHYCLFRDNSAGNKYNPNSFVYGMNILSSLEDLMIFWNRKEQQFLDMQKVSLIFTEHKNLCRVSNKNSKKELLSLIEKSDCKELLQGIKFNSMQSRKSKILFLLVKNFNLFYLAKKLGFIV